MDEQRVKQMMLRHGLFWGWAIITPAVVMVVLDIFDKHTPNNIAMFSGFCIMIPFLFCNHYVSRQFASLIPNESES